MFADRLSRHRQTHAELAERLAVVGAKPVEQLAAARIGQRLEHLIHEHNMQPFSCMSSEKKSRQKNKSRRPDAIGGVLLVEALPNELLLVDRIVAEALLQR